VTSFAAKPRHRSTLLLAVDRTRIFPGKKGTSNIDIITLRPLVPEIIIDPYHSL
jgi:hypothetical protein